jgi:uncharacterized protein (TIGR02391 family)
MNLETRIDGRLWDAIHSSVENRNYTAAIQDGMYFLGDLIRERSGLEGDGVALVGQAFGGRKPVLKVNKLKTESDKSVQMGIEQLLRGLYQAVRNPRSHGKYADSEEDAAAIILFVNYIIGIIDKSKTPFSEHDFIARVIDPDFVPNRRYAQLLVREIPKKKRMDIFYGVFERITEGDGDKLKYFFDALLRVVSSVEKQEIYHAISEVLRQTSKTATIVRIIQAFPEVWPKLEESARLRTENKLIGSIKDDKWDPKTKRCRHGGFGAWSPKIIRHFGLKDDVLHALTNKLASSDRGEQDYVFRFFQQVLDDLADSPSRRLKNIITNGLKAGDVRFKDMVVNSFCLSRAWTDPFKELLESFRAIPLPYDPEYDDGEIPF